MTETLNALIDASSLPMSVIIVGVGEEDFTAMKVLDADDKRLAHEGRKADRDVVQFIGEFISRIFVCSKFAFAPNTKSTQKN